MLAVFSAGVEEPPPHHHHPRWYGPAATMVDSMCAHVCVCVWQEGFSGISSSEEDTEVRARAPPHCRYRSGRRLLHQSAGTRPGVFYCSAVHSRGRRPSPWRWGGRGWGGDMHGNRLRLKCVKNCPLRVAHKYFFPQRKPGNADASLKAGESPSALSEKAGSLPGRDITPPPCPRSTTTPTR